MTRCSSCGAPYSKYCTECGHPLEAEYQATERQLRMRVFRLRQLLDEVLYSLNGPGSDSIRDKIVKELGDEFSMHT